MFKGCKLVPGMFPTVVPLSLTVVVQVGRYFWKGENQGGREDKHVLGHLHTNIPATIYSTLWQS